MEATTYSNFRKHLRKYMSEVNKNSVSLIVTNKDEENIVVISQSDYESLQENLYIRSSKANVESLDRSIEQMEKGQVTEIDWESLWR